MKHRIAPCSLLSFKYAICLIMLINCFALAAGAKDGPFVAGRGNGSAGFGGVDGYRFQPLRVTGKITDEKGAGVQGVNVLEKGTQNGVVTDAEGNYTISVTGANSILEFSSVGYANQEVAVGTTSMHNIKLTAGAKNLEDVVVIGYGTKKRSELTNAVVQASGDEIKKSNNISLSNSLSGRLAGLYVNQRSAVPGFDDAQILVRGPKTYRNSSALIVIDGVANADPDGLSRIDPNDVESISVLKDASAAIYGAQSAGGVILVTTKRGRTGKPSFNFSTVHSFQSPTMKARVADVFEYTKVLNDRRKLEGTPADFPDELIESFRNGTRRPEDWYAALIDPPAKQSRQSLTMRGGTDRVKYFVSLGMASQGGILRGDDKTKLHQYNVRSNIDVTVTKDFEVGLDISAREKNTQTPQGNPGGDVGAFAFVSPLQEAYIYGDYRYPGEGWSQSNPAARLLSPGYRKYLVDVYSGTVRFKYNLPVLKGFSLDGFANIVKTTNFNKVFNYTWRYYERDTIPGRVVEKPSRTVEDIGLREDFGQSLRITSNIRLSYNAQFSDHKFNVFVAYEQMDYKDNGFYAQRLGYDSPLIDQLFAGSPLRQNWSNDGGANESARQNYFGRIGYDYKGKYLLGFSARYDGSPIFPKDTRFGFFPQASAAWVVSKENFMASSFINNLKVRASWGQLGNDRVDSFQYIGAFAYAPGFVINGSDVRGIAATRTPNPNITWEVTETTDLGLEAGFLNNRLTFEADVFKTSTSKILGRRQASIPSYTGLILPDENIGKMESKGYELQAGYFKRVGQVSLNVKGNFSYNTNKIIYFDETPQAEPYQKLEGQRFASELVYKAIGIYRSAGDLTKYTSYPGASVGGLIFADLNSDGVINSKDQYRYYTDSNRLATTQYGLTLGAEYKDFDFTVLFQGQSGAKWRLSSGFNSGANGNGLAYVANNSFSLENPNAELPMISPTGVAASNSDFYYHTATWLRLKSVELGYTLPNRLLSRVGMSALRVFVSGDNLTLLFNNLKKYGAGDPEFLSGNGGVYPNMKILSFGVNVSF